MIEIFRVWREMFDWRQYIYICQKNIPLRLLALDHSGFPWLQNEGMNLLWRGRLTFWIKFNSLLQPAKKKAKGRLPQHKWCEILLDGLKSVFRDPKARLLEHLKGCGANQDDFGMITFRLDWVEIKSDFLWTGFALNSAQASFRGRSHDTIWSWKCVQVETW